jgi:hypothetical protein
VLFVSSATQSVLLQLHTATPAARHWCKLLHTARTVTFSYTYLRGNTRQATINILTERRDKENAFLLCRGHFNQHTVLPTGKWSLNTVYQTEHIAITLYNEIHITQIVNLFETVLNYRIIAIGYVKWEKCFRCFRRSIHQRRGMYIVIKHICPRAVRHGETKCTECLRWGKFCDVAFMLFVFSRIKFRRRTKKTVSLTFLDICACTPNTFFEHNLYEAQYMYPPHKDVSFNDGPHTRRWSRNNIIQLYYYNTIVYSVQ